MYSRKDEGKRGRGEMRGEDRSGISWNEKRGICRIAFWNVARLGNKRGDFYKDIRE